MKRFVVLILFIVCLSNLFGQRRNNNLNLFYSDTFTYNLRQKTIIDTVYIQMRGENNKIEYYTGLHIRVGYGSDQIYGFFDTIKSNKYYVWYTDNSFETFLDSCKKSVGIRYILSETKYEDGKISTQMVREYKYKDYNIIHIPEKYLRKEILYAEREELTINDYINWKKKQKPILKEIDRNLIIKMSSHY